MTPTLTPQPSEKAAEAVPCGHCGAPAKPGTIFCTNCGTSVSAATPLIESHDAPVDAVPQVRPWIRYWARLFDLAVYEIVLGILIGIFAPGILDQTNDLALNLGILFTWIFVESWLLSALGTTPGKALFKVHLRLQGSDTIPFLDAFYRSLRVWWRGMGTGFPLVAFFTLLHAESVLSRNSITSWDKDGGFLVRHEKLGALRVTFAVIVLVLFYGLTIFAIVAERSANR